MLAERRTTLVFPGCHTRGGVERVVWEMMRHFSARSPVTVVASDVDANGVDNVTVRRVTSRAHPRSLSPFLWRRAAGRCLGPAPGVVVSFGADCPVGDVLVVQSVHRAWLRRGAPISYGPVKVPGALRYARPSHQVLLALEATYFAKGRDRRLVAVSANVAADLRDLYEVDDERVTVIPNGYSAEQCSPFRSASLRERVRSELSLRSDDVVILLVANEWHRKGLGVLLQAVAAFRSEPIHVLLVGRMPPTAYENQISRLSLTGRVRYCGATDDVGRYYAAADLFVMPTQYEAFGSVIVESLASGLPVITTAEAGAAVAVRPGINGLLLEDPLDVRELERLLDQALEPAVRDRWRQAAPDSVAGYEWSSVMGQFEKVLEQAAR